MRELALPLVQLWDSYPSERGQARLCWHTLFYFRHLLRFSLPVM
jgi:hypothetical protein